MRIEDLPPKLRAQALAKAEAEGIRRDVVAEKRSGASHRDRPSDLPAGPARFRCATPGCGYEHDGWSAATTERHMDTTGHRRMELVLEEA